MRDSTILDNQIVDLGKVTSRLGFLTCKMKGLGFITSKAFKI